MLKVADPRVMDSTGALDLPDIPGSLLVVGGGYIGLELGTVYAALGSQVTVVEMTPGLLPGADRGKSTPGVAGRQAGPPDKVADRRRRMAAQIAHRQFCHGLFAGPDALSAGARREQSIGRLLTSLSSAADDPFELRRRGEKTERQG